MPEQMRLADDTTVGCETDPRLAARRIGAAMDDVQSSPSAMAVSQAPERAATRRYDGFAQSLHWLIALLVAVQFILGVIVWKLPQLQQTILPLHKWAGITTGFLAVTRLVWSISHAPPPLPASMNLLERLSAKGAHAALQALTVMIPVTGWALLTAPDRTMRVVGFVAPALLGSHSPIRQLRNIHGFLAASLALIVLLHAAAALRHHFWLRDETLARMLPGGGR